MQRKQSEFFRKPNRTELTIILIFCLGVASIISAEEPPEFSGYYFINGKWPSAFEQIMWLELNRGTDSKGHWLVEGAIRFNRVNNGKYVELKFKNQKIQGTELSFQTFEESGVCYKFDGRFLITDFSQAELNDKIVLSGLLQKIEKGKRVAKTKAEFTYSIGD